MSRSVVVVSMRAGDWLARCLRSVREQTDELVVVDNGSAGAEVSAAARELGAVVVRHDVNRGFAGGVNAGIRRATGDVVALLNDDAVAGPSWIAAAERLLSDATVAAVSPKVVLDGWYAQVVPEEAAWSAPPDPRTLGRRRFSLRHQGVELLEQLAGPGLHPMESGTEDGGPARWRWTRPPSPFFVPLPGPAREATFVVNAGEEVTSHVVCRLVNNAGLYLRADGYSGDHGLETPDDGRFDRLRECFGVSGTALVARSETFRRVGLLAEPFFAYYEDTDWSWRARRLGMRLLYDPSAAVSHRRSVTAAQALGARVRILGERNRLLCMVRNAPRGVAAGAVRRRLVDGPDHGIRRGMVRLLPWATATRIGLGRGATVDAGEVWDRWAGADVGWDVRPCAPDGLARD